MPNQAARSGAQGPPDRHVTGPAQTAGQKEVGDVHARHEQKKADGSHQQIQAGADPPCDDLVEGCRRGKNGLFVLAHPVLGESFGQIPVQALHLGIHIGQRRTRGYSSHRVQHVIVHSGELFSGPIQRTPEIRPATTGNVTLRSLEFRAENSDDGDRLTIYRKGLAYHVGIGSEDPFPGPIAENTDSGSVEIVSHKQPTAAGAGPEKGEEIPGDFGHQNPRRTPLPHQVCGFGHGRTPEVHRVQGLKLAEHRARMGPVLHQEETLGRGIGEGSQENMVHHREDGGHRPDTEPQQ